MAPFWENQPHPSVILNVPGTCPVREMNGVHEPGFVFLDMARSVYPADRCSMGCFPPRGAALGLDKALRQLPDNNSVWGQVSIPS